MKRLILLLLLVPTVAASQQIPLKANTIIVKGVTFEQCMDTMLKMGYQLQKVDRYFQTVRTEFKPSDIKKIAAWSIAIKVVVNDSTATITSYSYDWSTISKPTRQEHINDFQIEYINDKFFVNRELFSLMDSFAKTLNPVVQYTRQ